MLSSACKSAAVGGVVVAIAAAVSTVALAQGAVRTLSDNEGLFIDGKTLTVTAGRSKDDVASQLGNLSVRALAPGAIVFRSGDRLYMVDGVAMGAAQANYDPWIDRQRSYGGFYDSGAEWRRQQSYGGLNDPALDRQRSYGGFYDSAAESRRQQSYGGLYDPDYANYKLKKVFNAIWGVSDKN